MSSDSEPLQTDARASMDGPRGQLFVVTSPSGGGKGTLIRHVMETVPGVSYSVSWTTRPRREGEIDGVDYHFVTPDEFESMRERGGFLEWAVVHGNLYGTARSVVEQELCEGRDIILEIDVQGATSVRRLMENVVGVFILPPSYAVLVERLLARGTEAPETLEVRLRNARAEVRHYTEFDYIVINDDALRAAHQLAAIFYAERARLSRQEWLARRILSTFPAPPEVE